MPCVMHKQAARVEQCPWGRDYSHWHWPSADLSGKLNKPVDEVRMVV